MIAATVMIRNIEPPATEAHIITLLSEAEDECGSRAAWAAGGIEASGELAGREEGGFGFTAGAEAVEDMPLEGKADGDGDGDGDEDGDGDGDGDEKGEGDGESEKCGWDGDGDGDGASIGERAIKGAAAEADLPLPSILYGAVKPGICNKLLPPDLSDRLAYLKRSMWVIIM